MRRELLKLQRQLIDGPDEGCPPFDRYTYNGFSWSLQDLSYRASSEEEKALCLFLRDLAKKKAEYLHQLGEVAV